MVHEPCLASKGRVGGCTGFWASKGRARMHRGLASKGRAPRCSNSSCQSKPCCRKATGTATTKAGTPMPAMHRWWCVRISRNPTRQNRTMCAAIQQFGQQRTPGSNNRLNQVTSNIMHSGFDGTCGTCVANATQTSGHKMVQPMRFATTKTRGTTHPCDNTDKGDNAWLATKRVAVFHKLFRSSIKQPLLPCRTISTSFHGWKQIRNP